MGIVWNSGSVDFQLLQCCLPDRCAQWAAGDNSAPSLGSAFHNRPIQLAHQAETVTSFILFKLLAIATYLTCQPLIPYLVSSLADLLWENLWRWCFSKHLKQPLRPNHASHLPQWKCFCNESLSFWNWLLNFTISTIDYHYIQYSADRILMSVQKYSSFIMRHCL